MSSNRGSTCSKTGICRREVEEVDAKHDASTIILDFLPLKQARSHVVPNLQDLHKLQAGQVLSCLDPESTALSELWLAALARSSWFNVLGS